MKLCRPSTVPQSLVPKMEEALKEILSIVETNTSSQFFDVYLALIFKTQGIQLSQNFLANQNLLKKYENKEINKVRWESTQIQ